MEKQSTQQQPFTKKMFVTLQAEEAAITTIAIYFLAHHSLGLPIWLWVLLFFSPDISMLGYFINTRAGAVTYNLFHHRAIALLLAATGLWMHLDIITTIGILLFTHSSFDRMMGYGLKYPDDFKHTSLGWVGKETVKD